MNEESVTRLLNEADINHDNQVSLILTVTYL